MFCRRRIPANLLSGSTGRIKRPFTRQFTLVPPHVAAGFHRRRPLLHTMIGVASVGGGLLFAMSEMRPVHIQQSNTTTTTADHTLVFHAVQENDMAALQRAIDRMGSTFDPNAHHKYGWTALHVACANGHVEMATFLLTRGADPNAKETTPQLEGLNQIVRYFSSRETEFSRRINKQFIATGLTPLHYAVAIGSARLIRLLFDHGADPTIVDGKGHTAKDFFDADDQPRSLIEAYEEGEQKFMDNKRRLERELRRKYPLEKKLKEALVGQLAPINSVSSAIRRKENGWADEDRPLVFLFLGSSGIGKTELAKQVAKYIHQEEEKGFIRIDMSEFQSKHEVAKFIGAPPGYVGYEEGGQLTKKLAQFPNAIVLLDEVEKAHVDVLTIMLQVFDEGRLTDGKGTTVDCRDAIFIMTSNLAQTEIADHANTLRAEGINVGRNDEETSQAKQFINTTIYPILRDHFRRDEFLGRINEVLFFLPFTTEELKKIVEMELERWQKRALDRHRITMSWTKEVVEALAEGYNIRYGARSIKHEVEKRVVNQIAKAHELDQLVEGGSVQFTRAADGTIRLEIRKSDGKFGFWR